MRRISEILMMAAVAMMAVACGGKGGGKADGPEVVVEQFYKAMAAGEWDQACCLCDTVAMKDYLEGYQQAWDSFCQQDSAVLEIASSMLADAAVEVTGIEKAEDGRLVQFTVQTGNIKVERKALVKKDEEGTWKVTEITEAL